mgnify:FL=1
MVKIKILIPMFLFMILSNGTCDGAITGSEDVVEIPQVNFSNLTRTVTETSLIVDGVIENIGETAISPPWKIECQFYIFDDDIAGNKLLGGDQILINNALTSGSFLEWSLELDITNSNDYQDFIYGDLRAIK